jgi:hypothetical protein
MITVARYSFAIEAHVARAKLESEGIPAFVADEHTITANWLYSNAMGGIRLQVPNSCANTAREILATDYTELLVTEQGFDPLICQSCGSNNVKQITNGRKMAFIIFLFLEFPLWPFRRKVKCLQCNNVSHYNP